MANIGVGIFLFLVSAAAATDEIGCAQDGSCSELFPDGRIAVPSRAMLQKGQQRQGQAEGVSESETDNDHAHDSFQPLQHPTRVEKRIHNVGTGQVSGVSQFTKLGEEMKGGAKLTERNFGERTTGIKMRNAAAEFLAMTLFVIIGCGSAMGIANQDGSAWILQVSLTFGLAITVLAYTIGHYSGAQINGAVTLGLVLAGKLAISEAICNFLAQLLGSVAGALVLVAMYPKGKDLTGGLGSNAVGPGWTKLNAFIGEVLMTFLLMYVVLETAVNPASQANRTLAPIAIGLAVFLAHSVLIPIDGCSINPTRSFGPAVVSKFVAEGKDTLADLPLFFLGPFTGAGLAALAFKVMTKLSVGL
jgi:MIP family channel proteins